MDAKDKLSVMKIQETMQWTLLGSLVNEYRGHCIRSDNNSAALTRSLIHDKIDQLLDMINDHTDKLK